jgi:hypothetical protein
MGLKRPDEFRADDLGVGMSTLNKWILGSVDNQDSHLV